MKTLKSIVKSIPPLRKMVNWALNDHKKEFRDAILDGVFYTGGPDVLIAIVKAFELQRQSARGKCLHSAQHRTLPKLRWQCRFRLINLQ